VIRPLVTTLLCCTFGLALAAAADAHVHVIASGETLQSIAAQEHVSVADLARLNQLEGPADTRLAIGRVLALDDDSAANLAPAEAPPALAAAELQAAQASDNPRAGADLAMWGVEQGAKGDASASPVRRFANRIIRRASSLAVSLTRSAMRFIGTPYVFGGTSRFGFDCSGYVQHVFAMLGIRLPRTADSQFYAGHSIAGTMLAGDLVFFQTYAPGPSHVGIYLGGGKFVHASSSHGVTVSRLSDSYWAARYLGAKRYVAAERLSEVTRAAQE
jgi:cell wall-associated NlpC family hydrolase